nr:cofactor-independent phosphoglycerate mutase [Desulfobulbaceae bacterium]
MANKKHIILIGDGMGDYPIAELGNKTPLEAASIPVMDSLAGKGLLYTLQTVPDGLPPGSDVANLSLLGYRPEKFYTGRSPLEAASMRVSLKPDETAFRCNLVTLDRSNPASIRMIDYSAGHISTEEAADLISALSRLNNSSFQFHPGISYRHLLVTSIDSSSLHTVPPHDFTDKDVTGQWQKYLQLEGFSELVQRATEILENHPVNQKRIADKKNPANAIWLWGEGKSPQMKSMKESYGVSGALISAVDLLKGIGVYAGMEVINVAGATGYLDTNYAGKAAAALEAVDRHDLVIVHVEAPDEAGHQGLLKEKIKAIEDFDKKIVGPIYEGLCGKYDFSLAITTDHYTPLATKTHAAHPVPIIIYDSLEQKYSDASYCEKSAEKSCRLLSNGEEFFNVLLGRQ